MKPPAPTDAEIREAYRLVVAAWREVNPNEELMPFDEWVRDNPDMVQASCAFVRLARFGLN